MKEKIRILIDAHVFDEPHQGTRTYIKGLYTELIVLLPEVSFFFASYNIDDLRLEFGVHLNVFFVSLKQRKFLRLLWEIPMLIKKHKIDYAHFQYISPPVKNCNHIVTTHDILFKDFKSLFPLKYKVIKDFLFMISARRADYLLTVSEYSRNSISKHYRIPLNKIGITPNGVPVEFLEQYSLREFSEIKLKYGIDSYILFVSRMEPRKNHLMLAQAFSELNLWEKGYKLVFVGKKDFSFHAWDDFLVKAPPLLKENILHLQNVNDKDLLSLYKNAALFVYPSLAEGFGIPPIESISVGIPTLCSNTTAMSEFYFLGDDLFDPHNMEELKEKILRKLSGPDDVERMSRLRQVVMEKYSWRASAKKFISFLEMDPGKP